MDRVVCECVVIVTANELGRLRANQDIGYISIQPGDGDGKAGRHIVVTATSGGGWDEVAGEWSEVGGQG